MELSGDGATVAVSYYLDCGLEVVETWVYEFAAQTEWGLDFRDYSCYEQAYGGSLSLDYAGDTLAIGAPFGGGSYCVIPPGAVDIIDLVGGSLDDELYGLDDFELFGASVSLSNDGTVRAVGAPGHMYGAGLVAVFELTGVGWDLREEPITGSYSSCDPEFVGTDVDLDADGNTVAVGSHSVLYHFGHAHLVDVATVYYSDGTGWEQLGSKFVGHDDSDSFVALSADGRTLATSAFDEPVERTFKCIAGCS